MRIAIAIVCLLVALSTVTHGQTPSKTVKCYKCHSDQGDCNTGDFCEGAWCVATITENKATRTRAVTKDCAAVNPTGGKDDGCVKDTSPDGSESFRCGCNHENTCNSETGVARMQAMLTNQFGLGGAGGAAGAGTAASGSGPGAVGTGGPNGAAGQFPGAPPPQQQPGQQGGGGQSPQVPTNLINPNSTFTDVLAGQPSLFGGQQPQQPQQQSSNNNNAQPLQPGQPGLLQPQSGQPGGQPLSSGQPTDPNGLPPTQFNGSNPQFPPQQPIIGGNQSPPIFGGPQPSPNLNKPSGGRPISPETDTQFGGNNPISPTNGLDSSVQNGGASNTNDTISGGSTFPRDGGRQSPANTNDLGSNPPPPVGQSRSGTVKNGQRTCACTEPSCNGPCHGEVCYMMAFAASDVHNQAFASKQGQIQQSGCTDDTSVLAEGSHHATRQISNYKFKLNGQDITVPASATYCNEGDYCNGASSSSLISKSTALLFGLLSALVYFVRF